MHRHLLLASILLFTVGAHAQTINIYNWSDYLPVLAINQFTNETGIKVNYITYESNEEMYDKVKTSSSEYDRAVPSTY